MLESSESLERRMYVPDPGLGNDGPSTMLPLLLLMSSRGSLGCESSCFSLFSRFLNSKSSLGRLPRENLILHLLH